MAFWRVTTCVFNHFQQMMISRRTRTRRRYQTFAARTAASLAAIVTRDKVFFGPSDWRSRLSSAWIFRFEKLGCRLYKLANVTIEVTGCKWARSPQTQRTRTKCYPCEQ